MSEMFEQALALQQQKKWDDALTVYTKITDLGPDALNTQQASVLYHNMSQVAAQKNDSLNAYIWSKKAFYLNPANAQAQKSFEYFSAQFQVPSLTHQSSSYDQLQQLVSRVPVDLWFIFCFFLILYTIYLISQKFILKAQSRAQEIYLTASSWKIYLCGILACGFVLVSAIAYQNQTQIKAIIKSDKASVQTVPGENKTIILEAPAGLEVEVLAEQDAYFQVKYSGAFTGWVLKNQLELLSLTFKH